MRRVLQLFRDTWSRFSDHGDTLAAATSFFMLLSVAPLLVITLDVAALVFDQAKARATLFSGLRRVANSDVVQVIQRWLDTAQHQGTRLATALATLMLLWAASRLFVQIQTALNLIWGVRVSQHATTLQYLKHFAIKRLISLGMVLLCGALLLAALLLQMVLATLGDATAHLFGASELPHPLIWGQELLLVFVPLASLFAMIYRVLPDARVRWSDVWAGAALTTVMTLGGTWLLGLYFSEVAPSWLQGATGSVAAFVLWTYYLAQVFFLGAAFTRVWSGRRGARVEPMAHAELVLEEVPATR